MMLLLFLDVIVVITIGGLLLHFHVEMRVVRGFAESAALTRRGERALDTALAVCETVFLKVPDLPDDRSFVRLPLLASLGASPAGVIRGGGCCSGKSRIAVVALHSLGISAAQATLYHRSGRAQHCLVEVNCGGAPLIIDPKYGLYFVDREGWPLGISELRAGAEPCLRSIISHATAAYPNNDYYAFNYRLTGTANWTKSLKRRVLYWIASHAVPGGIDQVRQPVYLEWPQLLMAWGLTVCLVGGHAFVGVLTHAHSAASVAQVPVFPPHVCASACVVAFASIGPNLVARIKWHLVSIGQSTSAECPRAAK